jgi:cation:H+ antiporter
MMAAMVAATVLLWNLHLGRWEAGGLALGMVAAAVLLVRWARRDPYLVEQTAETGTGGDEQVRIGVEVMIGLGTLALTLVGAEGMVRGAKRLAEVLDISSAFVGLVIVSVGTSLPELATALAAARRNETDLVLGNVVGSNLFNTLAVLAIAGLAGPGTVVGEFRGVMIYMLVAAAVAGVFVLSGRRVERWQGAVLLAFFMGFVALSA